MNIHTEDAFEKLIVEHLVLHGGYEPRGCTSFDPDDALAVHAGYDVQRALIPAEVLAFVQATQPKPWAKLQAIHGAALDGIFLDALCKVLDQRGALSVLRQGFKFHGQQVRLAYFAPGHGLNPEVWKLYEQNRLRVVRQLRYDPKNDNELDLALFLNGLPDRHRRAEEPHDRPEGGPRQAAVQGATATPTPRSSASRPAPWSISPWTRTRSG